MSEKKIKKIEKKRLFIAIDLGIDIKTLLFDITSGLNRKDRDIRPVNADNIHLTLKFLGDVYSNRIDKISRTLKETAGSQKSFSFSIGERFEALPGIKSARIIYAPVSKGSESIENFFEALEENLSKIKIRKENRKYISHITVARIKNKKDITGLLESIRPVSFEECRFDKVTLFESILKPSGAEYTILDEYELK